MTRDGTRDSIKVNNLDSSAGDGVFAGIKNSRRRA